MPTAHPGVIVRVIESKVVRNSQRDSSLCGIKISSTSGPGPSNLLLGSRFSPDQGMFIWTILSANVLRISVVDHVVMSLKMFT